MPRHVMLDIETFGLGANAAIVQIGAISFDPLAPMSLGLDGCIVNLPFKINVPLQSSLLLGMEIDQDTIDWWKAQAEPSKASLLGRRTCPEGNEGSDGTVTAPLPQALHSLRQWWNSLGERPEAVWAQGTSFDIAVLETAHRRLGMETPWRYNEARDTRTIKWLARQVGWETPERRVDHDALLDSIEQVRELRSALAYVSENAHKLFLLQP